jgi:alpha-L-arabinofuranosidase
MITTHFTPKAMFMHRILTLTLLTTLCHASLCKAQDALPVQIMINTTQTLRHADRTMLGINQNWYWSNLRCMDEKTHTLRSDFIQTIKDNIPMPLARMSGTASQLYNWKQALGPWDQRPPQAVRSWDKPQRFALGPLEWVDSMLQVNPDVQFSWTLNLKEDSAQDHADLAELLRGDGVQNFNGGENWAAKRIAYGLKKPVNLAIWELGNELEHGRHAVTYQQYLTWCMDAIKAIRSVDPDAKFAALAATSPWSERKREFDDWADWHRNLLRDIGDDLAYITFHPYYCGIPIHMVNRYTDRIIKDIHDITGSDRIKVYISEHSRWPGRENSDDNVANANGKGKLIEKQTHNLEACLAVSNFINTMYQRPAVTAMAYHNLSGGPWHIINLDGKTGIFYTTAIADLLRLYDSALGKDVLVSQLDGPGTNMMEKFDFSVLATQTQDGISLLLTNASTDQSRLATFTFNQPQYLISQQCFTAPDIHACNTADDKPVKTTAIPVKNVLPLTQLTIPAQSIIVLKIKSTPGN